MATSTVVLRSKFPLVRALAAAALERVLAETGQDIVEATKANMYEGHFYYTGLSRDADTTGPAPGAAKQEAEAIAGAMVGTVYETTGTLRGQVHIKTPWAAYAELGTGRIAPRPALTPAIAQEWPRRVLQHAKDAMP